MYFNTTSETGEALKIRHKKASAQETIILAYINTHGGEWAPSDIWKEVFAQKCPITSVRRAMTVLTKEGLLERIEKKKEGVYGHPEHLWKLKSK